MTTTTVSSRNAMVSFPVGEQLAHVVAHLYAHAAKRKHSHTSIRRDIWRTHSHDYDSED